MCLQGHFNKVQLEEFSLCQGSALLSLSRLKNQVVRALHEIQPALDPTVSGTVPPWTSLNTTWYSKSRPEGELKGLLTSTRTGVQSFHHVMGLTIGQSSENTTLDSYSVWVEWFCSLVSCFSFWICQNVNLSHLSQVQTNGYEHTESEN